MFLSRRLKLSTRLLVGGLILFSLSPAFAAKLKNLRHQAPVSLRLLGLLPSVTPSLKPQASLQELSRSSDFKNRLHIRLQETYGGYPVWGAGVLLHLPQTEQGEKAKPWFSLLATAQKGSMNGSIYQELDSDLQGAPAHIFGQARAEQALAQAIRLYQQKAGRGQNLSEKQAHLLIYVDKNQKAHWTYYLQFKLSPVHGLPARPSYLMDALTFEVYRTWENIQTRERLSASFAGGFGGNPKIGKLIYDGLAGDYSALSIERDDRTRSCYLENKDVIVKDVRKKEAIEKFVCTTPDSKHNNLFWDGSLDSVNGAYSPANDALFIGKIIKDMYEQWYGIPALVKNGKPMQLVMRVHEDMENAYWDGEQMTFGDGGTFFYPLVSLGVGAHEISHGFTEQHSNLVYDGQSGGLNEAFSDMAAQAAEFFANGKNNWQIGPEVVKAEGRPLRYMDHPALDCAYLSEPEDQCSIENVQAYYEDLDVHHSSGVFNRVFYLIGTAPEWSTKKAFDVMVQANRYYWTPTVDFAEAACGVLDATRDYGYSEQAVVNAFKLVGLDVSHC